jgi:signal transduction histidine kinase/Flp pilus assembly protein TadD
MPLLKLLLLFLITVVTTGYGKAQVKPKQKEAAAYVNNLTIADYDKLVKHYRYYKPDSAAYFAHMAIAYAHKTNNPKGVATMLNQLGMMDDNRGEFELSRLRYLQSLAIYRKQKDAIGEAAVIVRLGVVEMRKGNYDKAIGYFLQSLKVSERNNNAAGRMEAHLTLGEGYLAQRKYETALKYLNTAEQISNTIPFSNLSLNLYNDFGMIYLNTGMPEKARAYLQKGIMLSDEPQYQGLHITLINNLAKVYNKQGDKPRSIALQKTALEKARSINNYLRELQTLTGLGDTYGTSNAPQAILYFTKALQLVKEKGANKQQIEILSRLADLYKFKKDYQTALLMKEQQNALADSIFYKKMAKQVVSLQSEYQLYRSKASLRELQVLNTSQKFQRNFYIGLVAACVLIILVVAYYFYQTRQLNKQLNKVNADLQESNKVKDKLFSVLAHDLRAPFASVIDLLYLLDDEDITGEDKSMLIKRLTMASNVSLETLNMLLKWGEMQLKGVRLNTTIMQPKPIISRVIDLVSTNAEKKDITIKDMIDDSISVMADINHFEFVIRNLLSNAVKFTRPGGKIQINAVVDRASNMATFSVKDNGIGISAERLSQVFKIGSMSTKGTSNETGTSLGLVICKEFIEMNQGRIWIESLLNEGSVFYFSLPLFKVTNSHIASISNYSKSFGQKTVQNNS